MMKHFRNGGLRSSVDPLPSETIIIGENHEKQPLEVCGTCSRTNRQLKKCLEETLSIKAFI